MLAAGDTFRAAAVEQLQVWGERNDIPVIAQNTGSDAASVVYDAYQSAIAKKIDILIADTAGRLHTQDNLMQELEKIKRVLKKHNEEAPHETLLVIDGGSGQNAVQQAKEFHKSINLSGLAITKLDGTAKGGVLFSISDALKLPIRFIGVGEAIEDLKPFNSKDFVDALFD
jgi:fused signal recognition particle receptor